MKLHHPTSDPRADPFRLTVEEEGEGEGLITISEETLTSRGPSPRVIAVLGAIDLTEDEARWVHRSLGELLAGRDAKREPRS